MSRIECPTCGVSRGEPRWPSARTTPWSDDCACADEHTCYYHRTHLDQLPKRPPQATLEKRAEAHLEWQEEQFAKQKRKFRQAAAAEEEITRLKAEIDVLRGVGCMEAKEGEEASGPCGVCRKCAFRRGAEAMKAAAVSSLDSVHDQYLVDYLPVPEDKP